MPALIMLTSGFPFKPHVPLDGYTLMPTQNKNHIMVFRLKLVRRRKTTLSYGENVVFSSSKTS
jgi:hypothetical protein